MIGLSDDIELKIQNMLEGMVLDVDVYDINDVKLPALVKSRIDSFNYIKQSIVTWQNSPNAPSYEKLKTYIIELYEAGEASVEVLRDALRKPINYAGLKAEDFGVAMSSTPIILKAISEIDAGNRELKLQIESDNIDLKQREFKRGYPEKFANQEFYPEKNYHKEWHDEETDSVMLCPLGTKGEIITLEGLNIMLPKKPKNTEILFNRKDKKDQYWRRLDVPTGLTPENEEAYSEFILQEYKRRREGVWFMNNGEAVYLTPAHYMALQWIKMLDTGWYMDFRYAQRDMFYFTRACVLDKRCLGEIFTKSRRTGFTYQIICENINDGTMTSNAKLGIVSKIGEDAEEAFLKLSYGIQNLPFFFLPVLKGKIDSKTELLFGKPSDQSKSAKLKKDNNTDDYLNTLFDWKNTSEGSYDGQRMFRLLVDEASKPKKPFNLITYFGRVSPTINNGGRIVGKLFFGSTINPMNQGGAEFVELYESSYVKKRLKETGMTPTGLYAFFLPAHKNMEQYTDKYGVCHTVVPECGYFYNAQGIKMTQGSIERLEAIRKSKRAQSDVLYNEELRANPMTIDEAFRDELTSTLLDQERINEQLSHNKEFDLDKTLVRGNFSEKDGKEGAEIIWTPTERGRFLLGWIPPMELRNKSVFKRDSFGFMSNHPLNDELGAFGCDNYDQDSVQESFLKETENGSEYNIGSKGALLGLTGTNLHDIPNNCFFLEYITRPQTAEIFFNDVLMACRFYGMPILIENNKMGLLQHFYNKGYRGYCLHRFDKPMNRLSQTEKKYGGIPSSGDDVITKHWTAIESYIKKYVGIYFRGDDTVPVREEGEIGYMPFNRTLKDWLKFNVANRTKSDASVASGLAIMAVNRKSYAPKEQERKPVVLKLHRYTN